MLTKWRLHWLLCALINLALWLCIGNFISKFIEKINGFKSGARHNCPFPLLVMPLRRTYQHVGGLWCLLFIGFLTRDLDAKAGRDYTAVDTTITFQPGVTSHIETVFIKDDVRKESIECFQVELQTIPTATDNVDICSKEGTVSIKDDDGKCVYTPCVKYTHTVTGVNERATG